MQVPRAVLKRRTRELLIRELTKAAAFARAERLKPEALKRAQREGLQNAFLPWNH